MHGSELTGFAHPAGTSVHIEFFSLLHRHHQSTHSHPRSPSKTYQPSSSSQTLLYYLNNTLWVSRTETLRRVPTFSRQDVRSATLSRRVRVTRLVQTFLVFSVARPVPLRVTPTPMPTSRRLSNGTRRLSLSTSRTQRSTSQVPRWLSVDLRRTKTATISSPTFVRRPSKRGRMCNDSVNSVKTVL